MMKKSKIIEALAPKAPLPMESTSFYNNTLSNHTFVVDWCSLVVFLVMPKIFVIQELE